MIALVASSGVTSTTSKLLAPFALLYVVYVSAALPMPRGRGSTRASDPRFTRGAEPVGASISVCEYQWYRRSPSRAGSAGDSCGTGRSLVGGSSVCVPLVSPA
jgi:hypothetical protein